MPYVPGMSLRLVFVSVGATRDTDESERVLGRGTCRGGRGDTRQLFFRDQSVTVKTVSVAAVRPDDLPVTCTDRR